MKYQFNPTLTFYGRCEEALNFYKNCLHGTIEFLSRFEDTTVDVPTEYKKKIVHSEFRADGVYFMAADGLPAENGTEAVSGMIGFSINFTDAGEQERLFGALSAGGTVVTPLENMFWGARYGILVDKFGVRWEFNYQHACDRKQPQ